MQADAFDLVLGVSILAAVILCLKDTRYEKIQDSVHVSGLLKILEGKTTNVL